MIESASRLKLRNNNLVIETVDGNQEVSLTQIDSIIVDTRQCIISVPILVVLSENYINLVLSNNHHQPVLIYRKNCLINQFSWDDEIKERLWQLIVQSKMQNQIRLSGLDGFNISNSVTDSDEALLAKKYFRKVFGQDFRRDFVTGIINEALNYGYGVFTARLAMEIASHGYDCVIGVHHHSSENSLNFASDLVEPWRFVVDNYVSRHQANEFNQLYRQNLVDLLNLPIIYNSTKYQTVVIAMQEYVNDCLVMLNGNKTMSKIEVKFVDNATISHV